MPKLWKVNAKAFTWRGSLLPAPTPTKFSLKTAASMENSSLRPFRSGCGLQPSQEPFAHQPAFCYARFRTWYGENEDVPKGGLNDQRTNLAVLRELVGREFRGLIEVKRGESYCSGLDCGTTL